MINNDHLFDIVPGLGLCGAIAVLIIASTNPVPTAPPFILQMEPNG
jgi:hypothetical protein